MPTLLLAASLAANLPAFCAPVPGDLQEAAPEEAERDLARRGLNAMMDGDVESAIGTFRDLQARTPHSPLGYILEAEALWWKIYVSTADLLDPDLFDVAPPRPTPYDNHFSDLLSVAIRRAQQHIAARDDVARQTLYEGWAYALQARLAGLRGQDMATGRSGKKMRALLMKALDLDSGLDDAYLGLGVYNYLVGTLPASLKVLQIFVGLPPGSRETGLRQLERASLKADLASSEAMFFLAKNLSRSSERKYERSMELFEELARKHPNNPLWPLVMADLRCRLGQPSQGRALLAQVAERTSSGRTELEQAVNRAAREQLRRIRA